MQLGEKLIFILNLNMAYAVNAIQSTQSIHILYSLY